MVRAVVAASHASIGASPNGERKPVRPNGQPRPVNIAYDELSQLLSADDAVGDKATSLGKEFQEKLQNACQDFERATT